MISPWTAIGWMVAGCIGIVMFSALVIGALALIMLWREGR